jgi:hypothetical protein
MKRWLARLTGSYALLMLCGVPARAWAQADQPQLPAATAQAPDAQPAPASDVQQLASRVAQLEQAEADARVASADAEAQAIDLGVPSTFRIYGFADFGLNHAWLGANSFLRGLIDGETTFTLGNLNLYFQFQPDPHWQVLAEVRVTAYPDGVETSLATPVGGQYARTDTEVIDVASPATGSKFHWGGVSIERAYAQYTYNEHLNVRVGQFLTPYGIWNVDHGTPTLIALMMPHFISSQIFPARQIGVALQGAFLTGAWELGYDGYISNGRTATQLDFTSNKAFGFRLKASRLAPVPLTVGTSFYYGQIDDITKTVTSFDPFHVQRDLIVEGTEVGAGVDVSLDVDALRIRSEWMMRATRYTDGKRPPIGAGPPGSVKPDANEYDGYLLAAYQLPFLGLEPFGYGEYDHFVSPYGDEQIVLALGLNIHFTAFAQLKTEVARVFFFDLDASGHFSDNNMTLLFSRLAVAF